MLDFHGLRERVSFASGGDAYLARRTSVLRGTFVLERSGSVVAEAVKPSVLRRALELRHGSERYRLEPEAALRRDFRLVRGGIPVGLVWPTSTFRRGGAARLPATLPRPVRLFVVTLVLILWNRDAAAAAS